MILARTFSSKFFIAFVLGAVALVIGLFLIFNKAQAQGSFPVALTGYAWSSNIGWISMNCNQYSSNTCASSDYKVELTSHFSLTGYAWSSNIGWIQFGGLTGCPGGSCDARLDTSTNQLMGWARALSHGGGWDGWISLNCVNTGTCDVSNYGVQVGFNAMSNYAWGSDVVGWVDFSLVTFQSPCIPGTSCVAGNTGNETIDQWCNLVSQVDCTAGFECSATNGYTCVVTVPTGTLTASPSLVRSGETTSLNWSVSDFSRCEVRQESRVLVNFNQSDPTGSVDTGSIQNENQYDLYCIDAVGDEHLVDTVVVSVTGFVEET